MIRSELLQAASPVFAELVPPEGCRVSSSDGFRLQLTISIKETVIGIDQGTPQHLLASVLEVVRNAQGRHRIFKYVHSDNVTASAKEVKAT